MLYRAMLRALRTTSGRQTIASASHWRSERPINETAISRNIERFSTSVVLVCAYPHRQVTIRRDICSTDCFVFPSTFFFAKFVSHHSFLLAGLANDTLLSRTCVHSFQHLTLIRYHVQVRFSRRCCRPCACLHQHRCFTIHDEEYRPYCASRPVHFTHAQLLRLRRSHQGFAHL